MAVKLGLPSVRFENAGAKRLDEGIATFGQVFLPGEIPRGSAPTATIGGAGIAIQMDVKTRHQDGSVEMAVLAAERPALAVGAAAELKLGVGPQASAAPISLATALAGHSFVAELVVSGGGSYRVDVLAELGKALSAGTASFWQQGELASQARVEVTLAGSQRLVFDVTAFKGGGFAVDAQFNNDRAMGSTGGGVSYDLAVRMDGKLVAQESVTQAQYQNFQRSFASNAHDGGQGAGSPEAGWLNIRQDIAHLQATGAIAKYDLGLELTAGAVEQARQITQAPDFGDALAVNGVTQYMPMPGGRGDIGFTTASNVSWLISQNADMAQLALGQAQTAGAIPWNFYDAANKTWLNTDAYPRLWTDPRGGTGTPGDRNSGGLTQQMSGDTGWTPEIAHQPDLSYVPYLLTGERWILDNLQAQAVFNLMHTWPHERQDGQGLLANGGEVRGGAWALRQIGEAAWASPEGSAEQAYFAKVNDTNWKWLVSKIPEWTAIQGEAHGYIPAPSTPNEHRALAAGLLRRHHHRRRPARQCRRADVLKWQENFLIGRFLNDAQGFNSRDGVAYVLARGDEATGRVFTTWAEMGANTVARGWSNLDGWEASGGDYAQLGLATLAGIYDLTGNPAAKAAYEALMAKAPPFASEADFARNPAGPSPPRAAPPAPNRKTHPPRPTPQVMSSRSVFRPMPGRAAPNPCSCSMARSWARCGASTLPMLTMPGRAALRPTAISMWTRSN
jgi:hypothetical protein